MWYCVWSTVLLRLLTDASMSMNECSSDKCIVGSIVDLTLSLLTKSTHLLHSNPSISVKKKLRASLLTSQCAKAHSTGFRPKDDLYSHFSLITTSTSFSPCQYQYKAPAFDSSYVILTVFTNRANLLQTSRPLTHESIKSDDGIIHSNKRI